jgi:hypothetical protein
VRVAWRFSATLHGKLSPNPDSFLPSENQAAERKGNLPVVE